MIRLVRVRVKELMNDEKREECAYAAETRATIEEEVDSIESKAMIV